MNYNELTNAGNVKWSQAAGGGIRLDVDPLASLILAAIDAGEVKEGGVPVVASAGTAPEGYVRWADGTQIAWKTVQSGSINAPHGSLFLSAVITGVAWPASFFGDAPKVVSQTISDSGNAPRWHGHGTGAGSTTTTPPVWAIAGVSTINTATIRMVGIGRWK